MKETKLNQHVPAKTDTQNLPLKPGTLFFIAGPCVIESEQVCLTIADRLATLALRNGIQIIFKASYDKANRTSVTSFRGPGPQEGLRILETVKRTTGLPILTDIHEAAHAAEAAEIADVLQIPAFLCRQTDLLAAAAKTGKIVNIKKGQFLSPAEMAHPIQKTGELCWVTERGTFFGYNRLVVDFSGFETLRSFGRPLVFDATHSIQAPGSGNGCSGGNRDQAVPLAKAALTMGADGLFFEVHPDPDRALCDGPNSLQLDFFAQELPRLVALRKFLHTEYNE